MQRIILSLLGLMMAAASAIAQPQPEAYRLYDAKGKPVDFGTMTDSLSKQNVVFVGEMHNCPVTHWLELKILQSLYSAKKDKVAVGMEMLESDNQLIIDEYLDGVITSDRFENECRLWPNYSTDYEPLVEFANEHKLRVFATNVPRRYANSVKNNGCNILDSLSEEARRYLPPLPLKLKENEQTKEAFGMMSMMRKNAHPEFMAQSQALKDATMAWNISKHQDFLTVHFNGNYHTDGGDGIINYLKGYWKGVKFKSICSVRQEDISHLDECNIGRADFYICVPEDMVTTY